MATPDSPIAKLRKRNKIEKIPVISETMAEPNLSFSIFTSLDFCLIV